jgi:hypothetical protein
VLLLSSTLENGMVKDRVQVPELLALAPAEDLAELKSRRRMPEKSRIDRIKRENERSK